MPIFKVTLKISDGLALGSILMTKGVELIHIEETNETIKSKIVSSENNIKTSKRKEYRPFKHPNGKKIVDFIIEQLTESSSGIKSWREINDNIKSLGFAKSSVNSGLNRLINDGIIKRDGYGTYKLLKK